MLQQMWMNAISWRSMRVRMACRESSFVFSLGKIVYDFHVHNIFLYIYYGKLIIVFTRERLLILFMCVRLLKFLLGQVYSQFC
jgi:hypothetical protein